MMQNKFEESIIYCHQGGGGPGIRRGKHNFERQKGSNRKYFIF